MFFSIYCFTLFGDHSIRNTKKLLHFRTYEIENIFEIKNRSFGQTKFAVLVRSNVHNVYVSFFYVKIKKKLSTSEKNAYRNYTTFNRAYVFSGFLS